MGRHSHAAFHDVLLEVQTMSKHNSFCIVLACISRERPSWVTTKSSWSLSLRRWRRSTQRCLPWIVWRWPAQCAKLRMIGKQQLWSNVVETTSHVRSHLHLIDILLNHVKTFYHSELLRALASAGGAPTLSEWRSWKQWTKVSCLVGDWKSKCLIPWMIRSNSKQYLLTSGTMVQIWIQIQSSLEWCLSVAHPNKYVLESSKRLLKSICLRSVAPFFNQ